MTGDGDTGKFENGQTYFCDVMHKPNPVENISWDRTWGSCRMEDKSYDSSHYELKDDREYSLGECRATCETRAGGCTAIEWNPDNGSCYHFGLNGSPPYMGDGDESKYDTGEFFFCDVMSRWTAPAPASGVTTMQPAMAGTMDGANIQPPPTVAEADYMNPKEAECRSMLTSEPNYATSCVADDDHYLKSCMIDLEEGKENSQKGNLRSCNGGNDAVNTAVTPTNYPTAPANAADCHNTCQMQLQNLPEYPQMSMADDDAFRSSCITACTVSITANATDNGA